MGPSTQGPETRVWVQVVVPEEASEAGFVCSGSTLRCSPKVAREEGKEQAGNGSVPSWKHPVAGHSEGLPGGPGVRHPGAGEEAGVGLLSPVSRLPLATLGRGFPAPLLWPDPAEALVRQTPGPRFLSSGLAWHRAWKHEEAQLSSFVFCYGNRTPEAGVDNEQKFIWLTVLEAGKSRSAMLASGGGLRAASPCGGRQKTGESKGEAAEGLSLPF